MKSGLFVNLRWATLPPLPPFEVDDTREQAGQTQTDWVLCPVDQDDESRSHQGQAETNRRAGQGDSGQEANLNLRKQASERHSTAAAYSRTNKGGGVDDMAKQVCRQVLETVRPQGRRLAEAEALLPGGGIHAREDVGSTRI
ncbi:hypothetical protein PG987_001269 [Apiospora arundinis]